MDICKQNNITNIQMCVKSKWLPLFTYIDNFIFYFFVSRDNNLIVERNRFSLLDKLYLVNGRKFEIY